MGKQLITTALQTFTLPFKTVCGQIKDVNLDVLYPHELFSTLYHNFRAEFNKRILGGASTNARTFWQKMRNHPAYQGHPMRKNHRYNHLLYAVPLGLHGDGVVTVGSGKKWARLVEVLSWCSIIGSTGASWVNNFIVVMLIRMLLSTDPGLTTMDFVWRELTWSFYWLYQGIFPDRDSSGRMYTPSDGDKFTKRLTPLAEGFYGVLWVLRADLEWLHDYIGLTGVGRLCALCRANNAAIPWTSCRPDAAWIAMLRRFQIDIARFGTYLASLFWRGYPTGFTRNTWGAMGIFWEAC